MYEYEATIPSLWGHVRGFQSFFSVWFFSDEFICLDFMRLYPQHIAPDNALGFISDDGGERYNLCHCE